MRFKYKNAKWGCREMLDCKTWEYVLVDCLPRQNSVKILWKDAKKNFYTNFLNKAIRMGVGGR
jgi:hypothetical protein